VSWQATLALIVGSMCAGGVLTGAALAIYLVANRPRL
jgi:hypothetical protein